MPSQVQGVLVTFCLVLILETIWTICAGILLFILMRTALSISLSFLDAIVEDPLLRAL